MTDEEKAREILSCHKCPFRTDRPHKIDIGENACAVCFDYKSVMEMARWKDNQPIMESDGWHTEQPTEDGWYLVDTPDFPKNCYCVVAEWNNDAKSFYDEHSELPIKFHRWKLIEKG